MADRTGRLRALLRACGLAVALWAAAGPLPAASVLPNTDAALVPDDAPQAEPERTGTGDGVPGLDPAGLLREIDLLLDLQAETVDLGATPADSPASGGYGSAVDLRVLSPGLPANPRFPGYGLSFELPAGPSRLIVDDANPALSEGAPRHWSTGGSWLGLDPEGRLAEPIGELRAWVAAHRTSLLVGLGVTALLVAGFTALTRPNPRGAEDRASRRRRRRSGSGSHSGFEASVGLGDAPSTLPPVGSGSGRRRRRRSGRADPAVQRH